jgi:hypothetical protein
MKGHFIPPPSAAKENFLDRHFDRFCEAKSVKMAIQKEYYLAEQAAK